MGVDVCVNVCVFMYLLITVTHVFCVNSVCILCAYVSLLMTAASISCTLRACVCVCVRVCVCDGIVSCSQGYNKVMAYSQSSGCTIRSQLRLLGQAIEGRYAPREIIRYISGPWRASMCTINQ